MVRARDRVVLVDTGVGGPGVPGASWIGTPGRLPDELAAAGVEPDEIDLVVLTHLHLDHVGWNLVWDGDRPRPRFPRARYLVQRADWELFRSEGDDNDRTAFARYVRPLQDLGVAELLDGDRPLDGELSVLHTPGHTPGSQSLLVRSGADAVLRWRIVELLAGEQLCVAHLTEELGVGHPLVSHHLKVLRTAGLVTCDRYRYWTYYRLHRDALRLLADHLDGLAQAAPNGTACRRAVDGQAPTPSRRPAVPKEPRP